MFNFLTLKMLQLAPAVIKTKLAIFLIWPIGQKLPSKTLNYDVKWAFSDQCVKKMAIFCFDQCQS